MPVGFATKGNMLAILPAMFLWVHLRDHLGVVKKVSTHHPRLAAATAATTAAATATNAAAQMLPPLLSPTQVDVEDIGKVYSLFVDVKRSTQYLIEYQEQYMFNEVPEVEAEEQQQQQQREAAEGMETG